MKKNQKDTFVGIKRFPQNDNFFLNEKSSSMPEFFVHNPDKTRRLNDYDFNLLQEDAYKDIDAELFKLEYRISKTEENIRALYSQIEAAKDIGDYSLAEEIFSKKENLEREHERLVEMYNNKSLSAKISNQILNTVTGKLKNKFKSPKKFIDFSKLIDKLPKRISSLFKLKDSLNKLETLNKNVDELMSMNIPYGENFNKYEQLSKYIIKANSIQASISKQIKSK